MLFTRSVKHSIQEKSDTDPSFKAALLCRAVKHFLNGDTHVAKNLLKSYIEMQDDVETISRFTGKTSANLIKLLEAENDSNQRLFLNIIEYYRKTQKVKFNISCKSYI